GILMNEMAFLKDMLYFEEDKNSMYDNEVELQIIDNCRSPIIEYRNYSFNQSLKPLKCPNASSYSYETSNSLRSYCYSIQSSYKEDPFVTSQKNELCLSLNNIVNEFIHSKRQVVPHTLGKMNCILIIIENISQ